MSNRIGSGWSNNDAARVDGKPALEGRSAPLRWNTVGPQYFHVLGVPMLLGRDFTDADDAAAPPVVIVNETFAKRYLAGRNPLAHHVTLDKRDYAIVGVAADSRYTSVREAPWPMAITRIGSCRPEPMHFEVRTAGEPTALLPAIQRVVQTYGPDIPLVKPMTQEQQFGETFIERAAVLRPRGVLRPDGGAARGHRAAWDADLPDRPAHVRNRRPHRARRGARSGVVDDRAREPRGRRSPGSRSACRSRSPGRAGWPRRCSA